MKLLEVRKQTKKRKPEFLQQDFHMYKSLTRHWRKPRGIDSKMRLHLKGYAKNVEPGYGSPREVRGMHSSGLWPVRIATVEELTKLDAKKQGAILNKVGMKRRKELIAKARELNVKLLNVKDSEVALGKIETNLQERKTTRKAWLGKRAIKEVKKEEKKADKAEKKDLSDKVDDAKDQEKKEKDRLLTKKGHQS